MRYALLPSGILIRVDELEVITPRYDGQPGSEVTTSRAVAVLSLEDYNALIEILKKHSVVLT